MRTKPALILSLAVCFLFMVQPAQSPGRGLSEDAPPVPRWRGAVPGTAYLGPDVLWRPREWLVFHMLDERGAGFVLDITVRDMNTYMQGPRELMVWVVGPDDRMAARVIIEDDGIVSGNERYRDGIYDIYMDYRYREWHRVHSPGGYPAGKERPPYLDDPERLPFRRERIRVRGGRGLYRVFIVGSWDHWVSVTPDRPMATGVHPGPGTMYAHGDRFEEAYLYVPRGVKDIMLSVSEEVGPYNWKLELSDERGRVLGETEPRTFLSYLVHTPEEHDSVYRLRLSGETAGACLNVRGLPFVLAPDAGTARKLGGGVRVDGKGRWTFHELQRTVNRWVDGLSEEELRMEIEVPDGAEGELKELMEKARELLESQDLDPDSPGFGFFPGRRIDPVEELAKLAAYDDDANPYYGHPALVQRIFLGINEFLSLQTPFYWYGYRHSPDCDLPMEITVRGNSLFGLFRSDWYGLGADGWKASVAERMKDIVHRGLPPSIVDAWKRSLELWCESKWMLRCEATANQPTYVMTRGIIPANRWLGNEEITERVRELVVEMLTPGRYGRINPDPTRYRSSVGYTYSADSGRTGAGYLAEGLGWDGSYTAWSQQINLIHIYRYLGEPAVTGHLDEWNVLRTHLSMPYAGRHVTKRFGQVAAPTDFNFRTDSMPFLDPIAGMAPEERAGIRYSDMSEETWPCLEEESFVRVFDNKFFFVKTPAYYGITYGGNPRQDYSDFTFASVKEGSAELTGYANPAHRKRTNPGGISAVFVENCGPVILAQSAGGVEYSNVLWGRVSAEDARSDTRGEPLVVSSGYADPLVEFSEEGRVYRKSGRFVHAPLVFARTIRFGEGYIRVDAEITALEDVKLLELHEAVPYMADGSSDGRVLRIFDGELEETGRFAAMDVEGGVAGGRMGGFEITAKSGAGAAVILDREYVFRHSEPSRYRAAAPATRSINIELGPEMKAGESRRVSYIIRPGQSPASEEELGEIAGKLAGK